MKRLIPELSEIYGIHAGDGYLRNDGQRRELDISGNIDEKEYYDNHVKSLFKKVFKIDTKNKEFPHRKTYGFVIRNREIIKSFNEAGFPYGKKSIIVRVPKKILKNKKKQIHSKFLRGLFDTDGSLGFRRGYGKYTNFKKKNPYYPVITLISISKGLIKDTSFLLKSLGFRFFHYNYKPKKINENIQYRIIINGPIQLNKWVKEIGIKNTTKFSRYLIWKRFGFCPTNITFQQRKNILNSKIDPYSVGL